ncbi:adhesion G-protein coupled receptor G2-like [Acanthaster planci]|uniref:Adhesion G-protein coupled receptor G2-like n=1 Tax=Acanthaster planci TaxID=133434 RepID=A0A8B7ZZ35_ACAPL|nr:adhesion G-protein coupled receptor G2-like [Acanthaster planci]
MKHLPSSVTTEFYPIDSDSKSERVDAYECRSKCVYWDFTLNNGFGDWSNKGCRRQFDHEKKIVCVCDHLTSFAVLVDIYGRSSVALDVISKLICTLSTLAIVGTLITHLAFRRFRSRQPHRILINLCFALLGLYVIFLTGIEAPPCGTWCSIVAVLMHYFTLAAILWMAVEAINLYLLLVRLMTGNVTHFMKKACTAAWGFPLVIVILVLAVDHTQYSDNKHCFLKPGNAFYFGLLLPIGLILLLNFVIFVAVMRQLKRNANKMASQNRRQTTVQRLRNAVGISVLLGLTWIFGLLAIVQTSTFVFQVLFAVFNSAQGLLIFVLFCVRQAEVRQEWRRVIQPVLRRLGLRWNIFAGSQSEPNDIPLSRQSTSGTLTTRVSLGLSSLEVDSEEGEELKIK